MAARSGRFPRANRLRSSKDFRRVNREAVRQVAPHFVVLIAPGITSDDNGSPKLGLTVSRRVGGAVARNGVKRGIREWFRNHRESLGIQGDVVIIARRGAAALNHELLWEELDSLFQHSSSREDS